MDRTMEHGTELKSTGHDNKSDINYTNKHMYL